MNKVTVAQHDRVNLEAHLQSKCPRECENIDPVPEAISRYLKPFLAAVKITNTLHERFARMGSGPTNRADIDITRCRMLA